MEMGKNLVLIGFMGTGKSTIGFRLAQKLGMEFIDMDREIETVSGLSVADLFKQYGEVRFRSEEGLMAKKLGTREDTVIATGGGTVLSSDNINALSENGILICLDAQPEDIFARVNRKKGTRPLIKNDITLTDIKRLLQEREDCYKCASLRVNTSSKDFDTVVSEIIQKLKK
jgi:shikimate kinase